MIRGVCNSLSICICLEITMYCSSLIHQIHHDTSLQKAEWIYVMVTRVFKKHIMEYKCAKKMYIGHVLVNAFIFWDIIIHPYPLPIPVGKPCALFTRNWPHSQIPECTCSISHNAQFRTEMCTFLFWMEHFGIWNRCMLGFVKSVYSTQQWCLDS